MKALFEIEWDETERHLESQDSKESPAQTLVEVLEMLCDGSDVGKVKIRLVELPESRS